jgi:hypothetical protein
MSRAILTLDSTARREQAIDWINKAKTGSRVEFKGPARSLDQNSRFWAMLPAIHRHGMVPCGRSSSDLSVGEMSEVMDYIAAWGAENGITFHDQHDMEDA